MPYRQANAVERKDKSMKVRSLEVKDRSQWEALYHGYAGFYQVPMDDAVLETVWSWIFGPDEFYCVVAEDAGGQLIGLAHYRQMPSPLRGKKAGFLDDLFVSPECRGQGAVQALFDYLDAQCKENNWPFMRWITADNNYRGRRVYDQVANKTGWVTYQKDA